MDHLVNSQSFSHGMWPTVFDVTSGKPTNGVYDINEPPVPMFIKLLQKLSIL